MSTLPNPGNEIRYDLTFDQWNTHARHRAACEWDGCDYYAHTYVDAIDEGRVYVDGIQVYTGERAPLGDDDFVFVVSERALDALGALDAR